MAKAFFPAMRRIAAPLAEFCRASVQFCWVLIVLSLIGTSPALAQNARTADYEAAAAQLERARFGIV
jgi:hypothetical protein